MNITSPEESASTGRVQPRSRDEKKAGESSGSKQQKDETMDAKSASSSSGAPEDVYEFKSVKESVSDSPERKTTEGDSDNDKKNNENTATNSGDTGGSSGQSQANDENSSGGSSKRTFAESNEANDDGGGSGSGASSVSTNDDESRRKKRKDETGKEGKSTTQRATGQNKGQNSKQSTGGQGKSGASGSSKNTADKKSPCSSPKPAVSDVETEDGKADLKVPPLKIVIPQTTSNEQETGAGRNGKSSSQRTHQALPYVVASSNSNDSNDKEQTAATGTESTTTKGEEKKGEASSGAGGDETQQAADAEPSASASTSSATSSAPPPPPVELHPRKRKMKQNKEQAAVQPEPVETPAETQVHPHEQPITNCYQLFLNIRQQINKRRRGLFPVQPKPPQGFKDYLMNRCTYVLAGTAPTSPNINFPQNLSAQMKDIFTEQEKERYRLRTQHVIEKEKLVLSVEQEILRVHGRAARALANQSLPFSVCTILRDEEVYNLITPEQEEKDRNARSRYNGRLFLSWLQDVDDKWEKIKEHMLLRHHNEAESLHAVQKMDWEWKMKELSLCDRKTTPKIEETHVPMVHVSDDFDLLPA